MEIPASIEVPHINKISSHPEIVNKYDNMSQKILEI